MSNENLIKPIPGQSLAEWRSDGRTLTRHVVKRYTATQVITESGDRWLLSNGCKVGDKGTRVRAPARVEPWTDAHDWELQTAELYQAAQEALAELERFVCVRNRPAMVRALPYLKEAVKAAREGLKWKL